MDAGVAIQITTQQAARSKPHGDFMDGSAVKSNCLMHSALYDE